MIDHRPDIGHDVQLDARCAQRHHDVGEQDRRVHPVPADGLQRDLGDEFGVEARLHHGVLGPQRPVLGQRPACLPHEPHRHAAGFAAGGCGQIGRLGQLAAGSHRLQCCHAASAVEIVVLVLRGLVLAGQVRRPRPRVMQRGTAGWVPPGGLSQSNSTFFHSVGESNDARRHLNTAEPNDVSSLEKPTRRN